MDTATELVVSVSHPSPETLHRGPAAALRMVESFIVDSTITFKLAAEELRQIKRQLDKLDTERKKITRPLDAAKRAVMALYAGPVESLEKAEQLIKSKMLDYRWAEEAKAQADRLKREQEAQAERERLAKEASALEAAGCEGEAFVTRQTASLLVAQPTQAPPPPTAKGISAVSTFDYEVLDLTLLVKHVAEHPELIGLITIDSIKLRAYVKSLGASCRLPGVRVFVKQTLASRKG